MKALSWTTFLCRLAVVTPLWLVSGISTANPNACDDYLARHYKKDLVAKRLRFENREYMGDIRFPHQAVFMTVKNTGQSDFRKINGQDYRRLRIQVGSRTATAQVRMPLASGQERVVKFTVRPGTLRHCRQVSLRLDTDHRFGQWGCNVWNNDHKTLFPASGVIRFCRKLPRRQPIPRMIPRP